MKILLTLLSIFALTSIAVFGKTVPIPAEGASITIPDNWTVLERPNALLVAAAPGENSSLGIDVAPNPGDQPVNMAGYLQAMEQNYLQKAKAEGSSVKVISLGFVELNGVPACLLEVEEAFSGNQIVYSRLYNVAANGKNYLLTLNTGDPYEEPKLATIAESFRFDKPPKIPGQVTLVTRIVEIAAVLVILGLIAYGIRWRMRRASTD